MELEELEEKVALLLNRFDSLKADLDDLKDERKQLNEKLLGIEKRLEGLLDRLSLMK